MKFYSKTGIRKLSQKIIVVFALTVFISSNTNAEMSTLYYGKYSEEYSKYIWGETSNETPEDDVVNSNFNGTLKDKYLAYVYGGYTESSDSGNKDSLNNKITLNNVSTTLAIYGGYSALGKASNNTVNLNDGTEATIFGGKSDSGDASNNTVNVNGGTGATIYGGNSDSGKASNNTININGATYTNVNGGYSDSGDTSDNTVNINNGIANVVYGGYSNSGNASNNTVNINGGTVDTVYGGNSDSGNASNNKVILKNNIKLGSDDAMILAAYSDGLASNNLVYLDGTITTETTAELSIGGAWGSSTENNSVILGKNAFFGENIILSLFGSFTDLDTENTLKIWTKGISADAIVNFNNYYFILPSSIQNNDRIFTVTNTFNISNATIGVTTQSGVNLNEGDKITLIDKTNGGTYTQADMSSVSLKGGSFTTDYIFGLSTEGANNALIATVTGKNANDEIKAPAEGQVSSIALLNAGSDLIANGGIENAREATKKAHGNLASFAAISGGYSKYKTGSHIKSTSASLLTGFSKKFNNNFMSGVFVEAGYGDYTTHNEFSKGKVKGDGNSKYYGLGFMGRYDLNKNVYAEASVHSGYLNNDWDSNETKTPVSYDTDSLYYGAHLGLGYESSLNKTFGWGIYGKYFYTHQEGDEATIDGTEFDFKDVNSHITRFGTRLFYTMSDKVKPFMGVAWDHEFDGKAKSYAGNVAVDAPSLKGDTGMLEFGLKANNLEQSAWDVDASLQGFIGQREGVQGLVKAKYNF